MARKRNKLTPNQQAFKKEINRIKQAVRRAEKKGYIFDESVIPQMPKRVTQKALNKIKNYKAPQIYKYAEKLDKATGELVKGTTAREIENKQRAKKSAETRKRKKAISTTTTPPTEYPKFTDVVTNNFNSMIANLPTQLKQIFESWRDHIIAQHGSDDFAELLENMANDGFVISDFFESDLEKVKRNLVMLLKYLPDSGPLSNEKLTDALEYDEDWELPN